MNRDDITEFVINLWDSARMTWRLPGVPSVHFFSRGAYAGKAVYLDHAVHFNEILALENGRAFENTIAHELAHLITGIIYPEAKQAHGPQFRSVMQTLGYIGTTYHTYDVSSVSTRRVKTRYQYLCSSCGKTIECAKPTHLKIQSGNAYVCKCGGAIGFTGNERKFV